MLILTWTLVLLTSIFGLLWLYAHQKWQILKRYGIPHTPPEFFKLGHLLNFIKLKPESFRTPLDSVRGYYLGFNPVTMISDPEILRQIMIKELPTFPKHTPQTFYYGRELNNGLIIVDGDQWKRIRMTLTPTFSSSKLKSVLPILNECIESAMKNLRDKISGGRSFDVHGVDEFGKISLACICSFAFSTNIESQQVEATTMAKEFFNVSRVGNPYAFLYFFIPGSRWLFKYFDCSIFSSAARKYFHNLIETVVQLRKTHNVQRSDLLHLMLSVEKSEAEIKSNPLRKGLTRLEIEGQSLTMLLAGYETTSNSMNFLAYHLCTHLELQEKLRQEILRVLSLHDNKMSLEALRDMKYLEMCIMEAQRFYPAVGMNARICKSDITIKGVTIPKNSAVLIPVVAMHFDENYWNEPHKFIPERMCDMNDIDPIMFQPFGAGPRACIGMRFALLEMKLTWCHLLSKFRLLATDDTPPLPLKTKFTFPLIHSKEEIVFKMEAL